MFQLNSSVLIAFDSKQQRSSFCLNTHAQSKHKCAVWSVQYLVCMGCSSHTVLAAVCSPSWKMSVYRQRRSIFREHIEYPYRCRQEGGSKSEPSPDNNAALITNAQSDSSSVRSLEGGVDNNKRRCCSALSWCWEHYWKSKLCLFLILISTLFVYRLSVFFPSFNSQTGKI